MLYNVEHFQEASRDDDAPADGDCRQTGASVCTGYYACNSSVQVGRPKSTDELLSLIKAFPLVRGVGVGHSWFQELFCAGNTAEAIDIVLTEITDTRIL